MSYYNAIVRATNKQRDVARAQERNAKRKLFEVELIELDDFDESEILDINERLIRYAEAH